MFYTWHMVVQKTMSSSIVGVSVLIYTHPIGANDSTVKKANNLNIIMKIGLAL